jgi:hypothetical protein
MNKVWAVAALLAVAAIPIIILSKEKAPVPPAAGDSNDIFEWELSTGARR